MAKSDSSNSSVITSPQSSNANLMYEVGCWAKFTGSDDDLHPCISYDRNPSLLEFKAAYDESKPPLRALKAKLKVVNPCLLKLYAGVSSLLLLISVFVAFDNSEFRLVLYYVMAIWSIFSLLFDFIVSLFLCTSCNSCCNSCCYTWCRSVAAITQLLTSLLRPELMIAIPIFIGAGLLSTLLDSALYGIPVMWSVLKVFTFGFSSALH
jgi:hypothetical protein